MCIRDRVRFDIVIVGLSGGGEVFSVGSIAWSTEMTHRGGHDDVARITATVLDRFRDHDRPVPPGGGLGVIVQGCWPSAGHEGRRPPANAVGRRLADALPHAGPHTRRRHSRRRSPQP